MAGEPFPVGDADTTKTEIARKLSTDTPKRPAAKQAELNSRVAAFKAGQRDAKTQDASGWHSGVAGWNADNNADGAKVQLADYTPDGGGVRASNAVWKPDSGKPAQTQRSLPELRADYYITNRTYGGVLDINGLAKNLRAVAQEPGGQATVNAVMDKVKKDWSPEVQAQLQLRMTHSREVSEFFDPVRDNPHFETLKKAGLLGENASVADFYNLKYDLGKKSLGEVEDIAQKHGLTIDQLSTTLAEGSRSLGDRAFNTFRSFIQDPGIVGSKYAAHEADLKKAMIDAGVKPEHTGKLFNEMQQIAFPPNSLTYEQRKTVTAWTDALGVIGNSGGGAISDVAKLRPRPVIKPRVPVEAPKPAANAPKETAPLAEHPIEPKNPAIGAPGNADLAAKLKQLKIKDEDIAKIVERLNNGGEVGKKIADHIRNGTFDGASGLRDLLLQAKDKSMQESVLQALKVGERLKQNGEGKVFFEMKGPKEEFDIDVGTMRPDGTINNVYQVKTVEGNGRVNASITKAAKQLKDAPGTKKIVEIDVKEGTWAEFQAENRARGIETTFARDYPGIRVIVHFSDGVTKQWF